MELCAARAISNLPHHSRLLVSSNARPRWRTSLPLNQPSVSRKGSLYYTNSSLRSTTSEETSSGPRQYVGEPKVVSVEDVQPVEKNSSTEVVQNEVPKEDSSMDVQAQAFEFLDNLDIKLDSEDTYSVLLLGGGALVALWTATAVVAAIDSIPLFPKLMEVVGLGYTLWFSTRYLIFKKNREELVAKIEEIKQLVAGSNDD
ncbi:hypothetical protein U1Q18_011309 [Sarracenia purpurea var. burkii]